MGGTERPLYDARRSAARRSRPGVMFLVGAAVSGVSGLCRSGLMQSPTAGPSLKALHSVSSTVTRRNWNTTRAVVAAATGRTGVMTW